VTGLHRRPAGRSIPPMTGPSEAESPLYARLRHGLPRALKARDRAAVAALRSAIAAIDNAQAVPAPAPPRSGGVIAGAASGLRAGDAPRRELSEGDVVAIVAAEVADRRAAAADYDAAGQGDAAAPLVAGAHVLARHLGDRR